MKNFTCLALPLAVATALASASAIADTDIEALTERIQELEAKVQGEYADNQQQSALNSESDIPLGVVFSGYARYGAYYASGDNAYVEVGSSGRSLGRLGNEYNGGEFQFSKAFKADNGAIWDVVFMIDDWSDAAWGSSGGVNLKKAYAGASNIFESQPDMYVWAGRDFHQRPQQGLNDYFFMTHDGQGAGFKNMDLGGSKLDMGFIGQVDSEDGSLGNDTGHYGITSKLSFSNVDLYANYGFASDQAEADKQDETAFQLGAVVGIGDSNKIVAKYADGSDNSVFDLAGDQQVIYLSLEGGVNPNDQLYIDYLASYKTFSGDDSPERDEYAVIVRPMYNWNDVHSTWLEAGYAMEDYDNGDETTGWKVTLSQNISMNGLPWSRPMLRFYATVGDVETTVADTSTTADTLSVGAMWEAWW